MGQSSPIYQANDRGQTLESMYKTRLRDSQQSKTLVLRTIMIHCKKRANQHLEKRQKDRSFHIRNDRTASGAPIRRKVDGAETENKGIVISGWLKNNQCSKGDSCSFKHDMSKNGKGKRDRTCSPSPGPRWERCFKRKSLEMYQLQ